jgi:rhamnulose-1-phosphate aldolase
MTPNQLIQEMGAVGLQVTAIGAAEGSAGNLSIFVRQPGEIPTAFLDMGVALLPVTVPELAGGWILISGTGCRLRDITSSPEDTLVWLHILPGGEAAQQFTAKGLRPTSELNSHLAIHASCAEGQDYHAIVHAQPVHLTYLSHLDRYADSQALNRRLMRWEPETILVFPEGIGLIPFQVPGSAEQMNATSAAMVQHRFVIWQRHGTVSRSFDSLAKAADLVEYAETAAHYEFLNLQAGEPAGGFTDDELRRICHAWGVNQQIF